MTPSNKQNKIYIFLPSFQKGGIANISLNLINFFIKKKRKIILFTLDKNNKKIKILNILKYSLYKKIKIKKFFQIC